MVYCDCPAPFFGIICQFVNFSTTTTTTTTPSTSEPTTTAASTTTFQTTTTAEIFECPCLNGGVCEVSEYGLYGCSCPPNFSGPICENLVTTTPATTTTQPCPCLNGGSCATSQFGLPYCACTSGFTGTICQYPPTTAAATTTKAYTVQPSNGEGCKDSNGADREDGEIWALTDCISYFCVNGQVSAYNTCNEQTPSDDSMSPPAPCQAPTGPEFGMTIRLLRNVFPRAGKI